MRTKLTVCRVPVLPLPKVGGNRCGKLGGARRLRHESNHYIDIENMQATAQCGVPLEVLKTRCVKKVTPRGILRSQSRCADGRPGSNPQYRAVLHTLRPIEDMVVGLEAVLADGTVTRLKTCHAARLARTFATSSSVTRCTLLYH